jgi:NAD(P)-dependent dehydrogenase (short-subunit alcohol dehydrogenase family)
MPKTILITGAGSGFGEAAAIGLAKQGHNVIATVQVSPQVTPLRGGKGAWSAQSARRASRPRRPV